MAETFIVKTTDCLLYQEEAKFGDLKVVGRYSCDMDYRMKDDLSQMMYYNPPRQTGYKHFVDFNLEENYDQIVKQKPETGVPIEMVCFYKWIVQHANDLKGNPGDNKRLNADFVFKRRVLKDLLMVKTKSDTKGWIICAAKFQGNIYLYEFKTEKSKVWSAKKYDNKTLLYRHKFMKFIFSEKPNTRPDPKRPVYEVDEFCCVFERTLGDHKLLYRVDIDGVISDKLLDDPVDWTKVKFVDLRTNFSKFIYHQDFVKRTLVQWWARSSTVDLDHVLCGLRNTEGVVVELKTYTLKDILNVTPQKWLNPQACLNFVNEFLSFVKEKVTNDYDQTIYKFEWHPNEASSEEEIEEEIAMEQVDPNNSEYKFLEEWFVTAMNENNS